jgi:hypothetical protein
MKIETFKTAFAVSLAAGMTIVIAPMAFVVTQLQFA